MIKIGICDDDERVVNKIKEYIENYKEDLFKIETFSCGEELLERKKCFEAVFLDIDMGGINGIETARQIRAYDKEIKIIYVTSYEEYTNEAFGVHAFEYLSKPVSEEEITRILKEIISYRPKLKEEDEMVSFSTINGIARLKVKDIYYFEYCNRKIKLNTSKGQLILKEKIKDVADKMEPYGFYMPHKSFTVNLYHVKTIKGYDIYMMDGAIIPLSQKKSAVFREKLNEFLEKQI